MNATIYLPGKVFIDLTLQLKKALFLQYLPKNFDVAKNKLLVFDDNTGNYLGEIKVESLWKTNKFVHNFWFLRKEIAYRDRSIWSYLTSNKMFYVYIIASCRWAGSNKVQRKKAVQ